MPLSSDDKRLAGQLGLTLNEVAQMKAEEARLRDDYTGNDSVGRDYKSTFSHEVRKVEPDRSFLGERRPCTLRFGD